MGQNPTRAGPAAPASPARSTLAVWKFSSCDGCQLTLLNCEDELLTIAGSVHVASFAEASSRVEPGPYDLSLVEGSITTPADERRIREVRESSRYLVTIGACATSGGIQALRNFKDDLASVVYARPDFIDALRTSTPVADHVPVDFELRGCPVDKRQLLEVIAAVLAGRTPNVRTHSVCIECKRAGRVCVLVAHGTPCLGPVTQAGCGALCPAVGRGCFGCFGPSESPNTAALDIRWRKLGVAAPAVATAFQRQGAPR
jgi:sulfhydrogenase subunit delta